MQEVMSLLLSTGCSESSLEVAEVVAVVVVLVVEVCSTWYN